MKVVLLKSVRSDTSTSLTVGYYFVDPFGELGMVYLEVHDAADLEKANGGSGLTIRQLYGEDDSDLVSEAVEEYWADFNENHSDRRTSVTTYENSYTFNNLKAGTQYYVVMAHMATDPEGDGEELIRTLDDYYRVRTITQQNSLTISQVTAGSVRVTLSLEDVNVCGPESAIKLGGQVLQLSDSDIRQAVNSQFVATFSIESGTASLGQTLIAELVDENSRTIKTARISNPFYDPDKTSGAGGGKGSGSAPGGAAPGNSAAPTTPDPAPGGGSGQSEDRTPETIEPPVVGDAGGETAGE